jgi:hypothetical protein
MRSIILILVLFPCLVSAQTTKDDYVIYSQYLKEFQIERKSKIDFVVRRSAEYDDNDGLVVYVDELRQFLKNKTSMPSVEFRFRKFTGTLIKDTLWVSLLAELDKKMKKSFEIEDSFSPDLKTDIINDKTYKKYFRNFKNFKHIERNWIRFHQQYPIPSIVIEFSAVASDGQRAVFYFSNRCNPLCGEGDLVFFYKENNEWKYLSHSALWYN